MLIANQACSPIGTMSARLPRALLSLCCEARQAGMTALGSGSVCTGTCVRARVYLLIYECVAVRVGVSMRVFGLASLLASREAASPLLSHSQLPQSLCRCSDLNGK